MEPDWKDRIAEPSPLPLVRPSFLLDRLLMLSGGLPRGRGAIPRAIGKRFFRNRLYPSQLGDRLTLAWTAGSFDMMVKLRRTGNWDEQVLAALLARAKSSKVFWDVGANAGYMSLRFAEANPDAQVWAFEPIPELAGAICRSAQASGLDNVSVLNCGLSDKRSNATFHVGKNSVHSSMFYKDGLVDHSIEVTLFDADFLVANGLPAPDIVKIDIEGAETLFFQGAAGLLREHHPTLIFECYRKPDGTTPVDVLRYLQALGYNTFERLKPDGSVEALAIGPDTSLNGGDFLACVR